MGSLLREKQGKTMKLADGIFEIVKIIKNNFCCNDPKFQKAFFDKLSESSNKNLRIIIETIVTKL